jgi:hypothetical protein
LDKRAEAMRSSLADEIKGFGDKFDDDNAWSQNRQITDVSLELASPSNIIAMIEKCLADLTALQKNGITETSVVETVSKYSIFLKNLFAVPRKEDVRFGTSEDEPSWNKREVSMRVKNIVDRFKGKVSNDLFEAEGCRELEMQWRQAQEGVQKVETRVSAEMKMKARLKMSTIGSSHKLFDTSTQDQNNEDDDLAEQFDVLSLNEEDLDNNAEEGTIVIFDEAGCIPSFELLGLSRLGCEIEAILVVGDKHQLPPYDPGDGGKPRYDRSQGRQRQRQPQQSKKLRSLLDVSAVTVIKLTTQYRVPRDIADILNARIYNGNYRTPSDGRIPNQGLTFQHIPYSQDPRRKYVNPNEVRKVLELLREKVAASRSGNVSVMVLTPVSLDKMKRSEAKQPFCVVVGYIYAKDTQQLSSSSSLPFCSIRTSNERFSFSSNGLPSAHQSMSPKTES